MAGTLAEVPGGTHRVGGLAGRPEFLQVKSHPLGVLLVGLIR
jgi:hypothetical protein